MLWVGCCVDVLVCVCDFGVGAYGCACVRYIAVFCFVDLCTVDSWVCNLGFGGFVLVAFWG